MKLLALLKYVLSLDSKTLRSAWHSWASPWPVPAERWGGFAGYDGWFARVNNASLGVLSAYNAQVPAFERLFERSGKKMSDYIPIRALRPHWRNFFEDGVTLDLYPEPDKMAAEARKAGAPLFERLSDTAPDRRRVKRRDVRLNWGKTLDLSERFLCDCRIACVI